MMNDVLVLHGLNAFLLLIALFGFLVLFYGPWQKLCTDWARQEMFEARDAIFNMAARGKFRFDSAEYREIRDGAQILIRFCHHLTVPRLIVYALLRGLHPNIQNTMWAAVRRIENPEIRQEVEQQILKIGKAAVISLGLRSMVLILLCCLAVVIGPLNKHIRGACKTMAVWLYGVIQADAEVYDSRKQLTRRVA